MSKKRKAIKRKRTNKSKKDLLFQMKCNEVAAKNIEGFMSGEVSLQDLMRKVYGIKPKEENNTNECI